MLASVQRLVEGSEQIKCVGETRPADMIKMTSSDGDHIGIVVRVSETEIVYASSDDINGAPGGICYHSVTLSAPDQGLESQEWDQRRIFNPTSTNDGVYRLKILAKG